MNSSENNPQGMASSTRNGFLDSIGNTPLIRLPWASEQAGCTILGKAEFLNPGGSVKDRAALALITDAIESGALKPGGVIVEGTAGNTGIGLALVGNALGYKTVIVMPETQSQEKKDMLRLCGADLRLVPAVPYKDPMNYVRYSGALAEELGGFWANQFDNTANRMGHYRTTGPEIWQQTNGTVTAFTCAVGSGGTLWGVASALKDKNPNIVCALADPEGSALYDWVTSGELTSSGSSITEGIGQGRVTGNLEGLPVDDAFRIPDPEALEVLYNTIAKDGLVLGGSSGINIAAAIRLGRKLGPSAIVTTILCDGGARYQSKLYNPAFLKDRNLPIPPWMA